MFCTKVCKAFSLKVVSNTEKVSFYTQTDNYRVFCTKTNRAAYLQIQNNGLTMLFA